MRHLFSVWHEAFSRIKAARHVLLVFDYDGTLTPIVDNPEQADLPEETKEVIQALTQQRRFTLGIISGRALSDLRHRIGIEELIYAGNHGLEIEGPDISFINPMAEDTKPVLHTIYQVLSSVLKPIPGVLVEDKELTLSVHYRMVGEGESNLVSSIFEGVVSTARSLKKIRITSGKKVYEVRPEVDWDKGKAIAMILDRFGRSRAALKPLAVFLGDDLADEDGFKVVNKRGGISIFVGGEKNDSAARYYLKSPKEVEQFLSMLLSMQKGPRVGRGKMGTNM